VGAPISTHATPVHTYWTNQWHDGSTRCADRVECAGLGLSSGLDARRRRQRLRKGVNRGAPWAAGRVIVPTREAPWASTGAGSGHAPTCGRAGLATQTQGQLSVTPWISPGTIARTQVIPASPTQCSGRRRPRRERRAGPQSPEQARSRVSRACHEKGGDRTGEQLPAIADEEVVSITPTANLSPFSGTAARGRWTRTAMPRTSARTRRTTHPRPIGRAHSHTGD
jgi:hypothetical protein